jgi:DNA-binding CsgD family transcriptional regulator
MNKDKIISFMLMLIILFKLLDLYIDFSNAAELHHLIQEIVLIALSLILFVYLIRDITWSTKQAKLLSSQLNQSRQHAEQLSQAVIDSKKAFFNAINSQFDVWQLSPREKEIALLMIKGLSNSEIANVCDKSEKTVGHQASAIYKKANVQGRHELAALFFEELL